MVGSPARAVGELTSGADEHDRRATDADLRGGTTKKPPALLQTGGVDAQVCRPLQVDSDNE